MQDIKDFLDAHPVVLSVLSVLLMIVVALVVGLLAKIVLRRISSHAVAHMPFIKEQDLIRAGVSKRLSHALAAFIIASWIDHVPGLHPAVVTVVHNVADALIVLFLSMTVSSVLNVSGLIWQSRHRNSGRSIKGFVQIGIIVVYGVAAILMIAIIINRSPLILLSSLGALTAVLILVFQDTLLSFVAAIELSSTDILRVGDWITMPSMNANGTVIDLSLYSVTVRNFDNTLATFPMRSIVSQPFQNWRGMSESGARRIMRSVPVDQSTVRFMEDDDLQKLSELPHLTDFIAKQKSECDEWNAKLGAAGNTETSRRRLTNLGLLRSYMADYLLTYPSLRKDLMIMVRHDAPGPYGLPVELYCFTNTTDWKTYEYIQANLIEHMIAMMQQFELKVFQST